jgi:hypothetical protein
MGSATKSVKRCILYIGRVGKVRTDSSTRTANRLNDLFVDVQFSVVGGSHGIDDLAVSVAQI